MKINVKACNDPMECLNRLIDVMADYEENYTTLISDGLTFKYIDTIQCKNCPYHNDSIVVQKSILTMSLEHGYDEEYNRERWGKYSREPFEVQLSSVIHKFHSTENISRVCNSCESKTEFNAFKRIEPKTLPQIWFFYLKPGDKQKVPKTPKYILEYPETFSWSIL